MTFDIGLLLVLLVLFLVLLAFEWIPADVSALILVVTLVLTDLLPPEKAFAGFGSETVLMIFGLLILTAALWRTGVIDLVGRALLRHTGREPFRLLVVTMVTCSFLSAFISNTAATAFFVPIVMGIAQRAQISPSRLLMPLAFASILSSSVSLISTSTNVVVSGLMTRYGLAPMGIFELFPVGFPIAVCGLAYMLVLGRRWIPERAPPEAVARFGVRPFLSEILILPESSLVGKSLAQSGLGQDLDLTVLRVVRRKTESFVPGPDTALESGDVLLVEGKGDEILKIKDTAGIEIKADAKLSDPGLDAEAMGFVEVIILPKSPLIGRTLKSYRFRERYGLQVLGINRRGETLREKISRVSLRMGDVLLLQGSQENIAALHSDHTLQLLGVVDEGRPHRKRASLAIVTFIAALAFATFNLVPLSVAVIIGVILVFVTGCITPEEAYREVEWKIIILIGSMLALGTAMEDTGAARYLAALIVNWAGHAGPNWLLTVFFFLTVFLTQPMSNQAAAVVLLPIAIQTALQLEFEPRPFAMMIAVAASCSYLTPLEPSCVMVYGPGQYRFRDFVKVGSLLTVLIYILAILIVPRVWPVLK